MIQIQTYAQQQSADQISCFQQELAWLSRNYVFNLMSEQQLIDCQSSKYKHVFNINYYELMLVINRNTFVLKLNCQGKRQDLTPAMFKGSLSWNIKYNE